MRKNPQYTKEKILRLLGITHGAVTLMIENSFRRQYRVEGSSNKNRSYTFTPTQKIYTYTKRSELEKICINETYKKNLGFFNSDTNVYSLK